VEPDRWQQVAALCGEALEVPATDRTAFLRARCGDDQALRGEVESLLAVAIKPGLLDFTIAPEEFNPSAVIAGRFRIVRLIGRGGMGEVYQAEDLQMGGHIALKTIRPELLHDPRSVELFKREIQLAKKVTNPNACRIYDVGFHPSSSDPDAKMFLTMELLEGRTLSNRLKSGPISTAEALPLIEQMADALGAAHRAGVVHRDFKSGNVMLAPHPAGMRAVVMDFGLARTASHLEGAHTGPSTATFGAVGTPEYMAPEQLTGGAITPATDIYALGIVIYEMVTGTRPFQGQTPFDVAVRRLHETPVPPRQLAPDLEPRWEKTILRCLSRRPEDRFQSTAEVLLSLSGEVEGRASAASGIRIPWIAGAALILMAAGGAVYFILHRPASKLTEKDAIVLTDFTNTTGDSVFDGALRQGLSGQLEQSPFLSLLSDQSISETLALMGQHKDARVTQELGREVCQRTASGATIEGSISSLGSQYVLSLKAVNCSNGDLLAQEQVTANGKEQVLKALGDAATKLRGKLGESLASVQRYDVPPQNVTTPSLEALQAYSLGYRAMDRNDFATALPFFQRSVSLDPNFAMGYLRMGANYRALHEPGYAAVSMRKAYELRERTSEQEKLSISANYQLEGTGNLEAARTAYQLLAQTYPRDYESRNDLGIIYIWLGDYEKALTSIKEVVIGLNHRSAFSYRNLVATYLLLNRLDEVKATAQDAQARHFDSGHAFLYMVDFLQHDAAGMEREAAEQMGKPGDEDAMLQTESNTAAYGGDFSKARELTRRAADSARRDGRKETLAGYGADAAVREALVGNWALARQEAQSALALATEKNTEANLAIVLGLAGDSAQAARIAGDLSKRFAEDTIVQTEYVPMIHAAIALRSGNAGNAVDALASAAPYELGVYAGLLPAYLRGEAYLAAKQGAPAGVEFQKILDHPGVVKNDLIGALAHLGLGRAYALTGDSAKAKTSYQDFLALWKNADPDVPILKQAQSEYAKLPL
jgi:Flp pilus assembly protein TadD